MHEVQISLDTPRVVFDEDSERTQGFDDFQPYGADAELAAIVVDEFRGMHDVLALLERDAERAIDNASVWVKAKRGPKE